VDFARCLQKGKNPMTGRQYHTPTTSSHRPHYVRLLVASLLLMLALVLSSASTTLVPSAHAASPAQSFPIQVFFSKFPVSVNTNFSAVFPVSRVSPTIAVATFSIQLLIAGPTLSERDAGYFTEINTILSGPSNCSAPLPVGGPDFKLILNKKGSVTEQGTATLQFCRTTSSPGVGTDVRVKAEVTATLKQFSNIKKVVILTKSGHCFGDASGKDLCLK
jgi:hypothetical protein